MNDPSGSQWRRWDLHFHTPKSHDHKKKNASAAAVVQRLVSAGIEVVAVTDHHIIDPQFISAMRESAGEHLTVLPGIEFCCPLGGKEGVHFIGIFPEDADLAYLAPEILSRTSISAQRASGKKEEQLYVDLETTVKAVHDLGGLVSIHAHGKSSSIEGVGNNAAFKLEFKKSVLRDCADLLEIGNHERASDYHEKVFPSIGFVRPLIVGSDDHGAGEYRTEKVCWIKADPTLAGLRMALREPTHRFGLDETPPDVPRVENNKTKYIQSISFRPLASMPAEEVWLDGDVPLNPGLVAVIGNKGSGKSALADCIGLLGSCSTSSAFSFLEPERFRHPKTGRARHVEATMRWHDGSPISRTLDVDVAADEPERVKYLPQNFVEKICNDLATPGGGEFEQELKKVVFSKVAVSDRLECRTLDDLIDFRAREVRQEAIDLSAELHALGQQRARLESRLNPTVRSGFEKKIIQKEEEIQSHRAAEPKPHEAPPEDVSGDPKAAQDMAELQRLNAEHEACGREIQLIEANVAREQLRAATAQRLLEQLDNLERVVQRHLADLSEDAAALHLAPADLATVTVNRAPARATYEEAISKRDVARLALEGVEGGTSGLAAKKQQLQSDVRDVQERLSRPQREYQAYLSARQSWEEALANLFPSGNSAKGGSRRKEGAGGGAKLTKQE